MLAWLEQAGWFSNGTGPQEGVPVGWLGGDRWDGRPAGGRLGGYSQRIWGWGHLYGRRTFNFQSTDEGVSLNKE